MSEPFNFLTSLGHVLSTMTLYSDGHPARERAVDASFDCLQLLIAADALPLFSFLDGEVILGPQVIRELKDWDWGVRLAKANIQRVEFLGEVTRDEYRDFLADVLARLTPSGIDSAEARQMQQGNIRFGPIAVRGTDEMAVTMSVATGGIAYTLKEEAEAIQWVHDRVATTGKLPLLEAEAVVRSLSLAMHGQSHVILPLLELRSFDEYTTTHSSNVAVLAMALAEWTRLGPRDVRAFGVAGLLHDLGKVRIPRDILIKPGALSDEERLVMQQHPAEGARLIIEREKRLDLAAVVAYEHHIMLNGMGYPVLRFPRECHYGSKLVHVCDVYDALCTNRPYRDAWQSEMALDYLAARAGTDFDPDLATAFCTMMRKWGQDRVGLSA